MTTIWQEEDGRWRALAPAGFDNEQALHDIGAEAPDLLPLAGSPRLVVVGREVALSSGYPDLLAVELDGRLVIIEVKLATDAEARRAVVAQALGYAAALHGMALEDLEAALRSGPAHPGRENIVAAAAAADHGGAFDEDAFRAALSETWMRCPPYRGLPADRSISPREDPRMGPAARSAGPRPPLDDRRQDSRRPADARTW